MCYFKFSKQKFAQIDAEELSDGQMAIDVANVSLSTLLAEFNVV